MNHPLNNYYIYVYVWKESTVRACEKRIFKYLFNAHSAFEALMFGVQEVEHRGYKRDEVRYEVIRKGTRDKAKARGLDKYAVRTAVVTPWNWEDLMGIDGICGFLNRSDREWDKAEGIDY